MPISQAIALSPTRPIAAGSTGTIFHLRSAIAVLPGAAEGVATWPRILASCLGAAVLAACGMLWIAEPPAPPWWPVSDSWWLPGGIWTGVTQVASAGIALALIVYSYRRFHGKPEAVDALEREIESSGHEAA